jgi:hypothetical protein
VNAKVLLLIWSVFAAITALSTLFAPSFHLFVFGGATDAQSVLLTRYVGALYGGLAVMASLARNGGTSNVLQAIMLGLATASGLGGMVGVLFAMSGMYNDMMWVSGAVHVAFGIAFLVAWRRGAAPAAATA